MRNTPTDPSETPPAPWERQPREGARAFEAFALYRDMGAQRSLAKVGQKLGKSTAQAEEWSRRWDWVQRVTAWDAEQDRLKREADAEAIAAMRREQIQRAQAQQRALALPADVLLERLTRRDPELVKALNEMAVDELLKLVVATARASRTPVVVEWGARGYRPPTAADLEEEDAGAQEQELDEVIRRVQTALGDAPRRRGRGSRGDG